MKSWAIFWTSMLAAISLPAEAHTGHGIVYDFQAGFGHPWLGVDHLLVMTGIGLWAGLLGGAARVWLPIAFLGAMAAGAALSFAGVQLPHAEAAVSGSVLAIGLILAFGWRATLPWAFGVAALFAVGHGFVHAEEAAADSTAWSYAGGFLLASSMLLGAGLLFAKLSLGHVRWFKTAFGVICAASGIGLLLGV